MPEYEFSLTRIFPGKDIIVDSPPMQKNKYQKNPVIWHILRIEA